MNERGTYGGTSIGAEPSPQRKSSSFPWGVIIGGLAVGGAVLWAHYETAQTAKQWKTMHFPPAPTFWKTK